MATCLRSYWVCILADGTVKTFTVAQEREESHSFETREFPISCEATVEQSPSSLSLVGGMDLAL